jgi:hypothetical protein
MADMNELNNNLKLAIDNKDRDEILELVNQGADPNIISNIEQVSAFEIIFRFVDNDNENIIKNIKFLISKGADFHGINGNTRSGLYLSCGMLNERLIHYFLDLGVDVNVKYNGELPITILYKNLSLNDYSSENIIKKVAIDFLFLLKLLIDNGSTIYEENGELLEWIELNCLKDKFDIKDYYENSNFSENLKPAKR